MNKNKLGVLIDQLEIAWDVIYDFTLNKEVNNQRLKSALGEDLEGYKDDFMDFLFKGIENRVTDNLRLRAFLMKQYINGLHNQFRKWKLLLKMLATDKTRNEYLYTTDGIVQFLGLQISKIKTELRTYKITHTPIDFEKFNISGEYFGIFEVTKLGIAGHDKLESHSIELEIKNTETPEEESKNENKYEIGVYGRHYMLWYNLGDFSTNSEKIREDFISIFNIPIIQSSLKSAAQSAGMEANMTSTDIKSCIARWKKLKDALIDWLNQCDDQESLDLLNNLSN